jgi:hypothetical protein
MIAQRLLVTSLTAAALTLSAATPARAQCCMSGDPSAAPSPGMTCPMDRMAGMDAAASQDMRVLHQLLSNGDKIQRQVQHLPNGIHTVTRSDDPAVAEMLRSHVAAMARRIADGRPIAAHDPLFAELFRNARNIRVSVEPLANGIHVIETSDDPYTVKLLQEHAGVVDLFIARGMSEMHREHAAPKRP